MTTIRRFCNAVQATRTGRYGRHFVHRARRVRLSTKLFEAGDLDARDDEVVGGRGVERLDGVLLVAV